MGKGEIARNEELLVTRNCSLQALSPFPAVFFKDLYCRYVKTRACLGKG